MESGKTGLRLDTYISIRVKKIYSAYESNTIVLTLFYFEPCLFSRIESPPLPAGDHEHPKVGPKSINVKLAVGAGAGDKQARPALVVKSRRGGLLQVVVSEKQGHGEFF